MPAGDAESVALIVPTYNMRNHLSPLWDSFRQSGLLDVVTEIIFVDDGSTDDTAQILRLLAEKSENVSVISHGTNQGRFLARKTGAAHAVSRWLLFLDSRVTLPAGFGASLKRVVGEKRNVVGCIDIDTSLNTFCLYWQRTHELIFWRHYRDSKKLLQLTADNYDQYLKGTTLFLCSRVGFLNACAQFGETAPLSDDTYLMRLIVEKEPIYVDPSFRAHWVPRDKLKPFLGRLWERGPHFVEYHVMSRRGFFFWVVVAGLCLLVGLVGLFVTMPWYGLIAATGIFFTIALSTMLFSRSPREFLQMAPLHVLVVITCGLAVVRGILHHCWPMNKRCQVLEKSRGPG